MPQPERDDDPAAVLRLGLGQQHRGDHAVAQQDQERRPDHLRSEDAQRALLPLRRVALHPTVGHTNPRASGNVKRVRGIRPNDGRMRAISAISACAGTIQSIERAAAILRLLSGRNRRLGVVELAGELDLPKGTVHGILRTLTAVGFVEQDGEARQVPARRRAAAHGQLATSTATSCARARSTGRTRWPRAAARASASARCTRAQVLVVHHVFRPDDSRQALEVGALLPAHATALGKVLLAANRYAAAELVGDRPAAASRRATITDARRAARPSSSAVAERGWAADVEELVGGEASLAAPIQDRRGVTVGAIGISGPDRAAVRRRRRAADRPGLLRARGGARGLARPRGHPVVRNVRHRERALHRLGRPGHGVVALPRLRPRAARIVSVGQNEHHHIFPRPGLGRARPGGDLAQRPVRSSREALDDGRSSTRAPTSSRSGSPTSARRPCCGTARPASRCTTRSTGRTRAPTSSCRELARRRRPGPLPRPLRAAARHLLLRPEDPLAARPRRRACASAPRPARCCSGRWTRG